MLAIRLQRGGRKAYPVYRVVVQEANRHPLSGRIVAHIGSYNPHTKETVVKKELAEKYLGNGAQPSSRVARILKAQGVSLPKWVKEPAQKERSVRHPEKLRKNRLAESEAAPAEAAKSAAEPVEPADEAPAKEAAPAEEPTPEA